MSKLIDYAGLTEFYRKFKEQINAPLFVNLICRQTHGTELDNQHFKELNYAAFNEFISKWKTRYGNGYSDNIYFLGLVSNGKTNLGLMLFCQRSDTPYCNAISNIHADGDAVAGHTGLYEYKYHYGTGELTMREITDDSKVDKFDNRLSTSSKRIVGAINEVNDLAKSKGNGTITEVKMNGASKGTSGVVDLGTVLTEHQDISGKQDKLVSGMNIKTINGESVLGSGDITITSSGGAYPEVNHGTGDTTFTLTPNTFHVWDEVTSLTLNFGSGISGMANEYLFQFTSGPTATSLALPDDIKWANDNVPTIEANMIYQVSILRGLASVLEFNNAKVFPIIGSTNGYQNEEYAKVYEYFVNTYNLTSASYNPSSGVIITETLLCNDVKYGGRVLKVSLSGNYLLLWTQNAIDGSFVPRINNLGVYSTYYWD